MAKASARWPGRVRVGWLPDIGADGFPRRCCGSGPGPTPARLWKAITVRRDPGNAGDRTALRQTGRTVRFFRRATGPPRISAATPTRPGKGNPGAVPAASVGPDRLVGSEDLLLNRPEWLKEPPGRDRNGRRCAGIRSSRFWQGRRGHDQRLVPFPGAGATATTTGTSCSTDGPAVAPPDGWDPQTIPNAIRHRTGETEVRRRTRITDAAQGKVFAGPVSGLATALVGMEAFAAPRVADGIRGCRIAALGAGTRRGRPFPRSCLRSTGPPWLVRAMLVRVGPRGAAESGRWVLFAAMTAAPRCGRQMAPGGKLPKSTGRLAVCWTSPSGRVWPEGSGLNRATLGALSPKRHSDRPAAGWCKPAAFWLVATSSTPRGQPGGPVVGTGAVHRRCGLVVRLAQCAVRQAFRRADAGAPRGQRGRPAFGGPLVCNGALKRRAGPTPRADCGLAGPDRRLPKT